VHPYAEGIAGRLRRSFGKCGDTQSLFILSKNEKKEKGFESVASRQKTKTAL